MLTLALGVLQSWHRYATQARDGRGIDLAIDHGGRLTAIEAKAGRTPASAYVTAIPHLIQARSGAGWLPNLRILVSHGLLVKSGASTRGGRRAYYRMPDRKGVAAAVDVWRRNGATARRRLSFIGAGASTEPPSDMGRKAGEVRYEPRSWR